MEVVLVRYVKLFILIGLVGLFVWGCVEDLETGANMEPNVWFIWAPDSNSVIFQNSADFFWISTDHDDDLGMGATYVRLEPNDLYWYNIDTDDTVHFEHPRGWQRVYENNYQLLDLPDTSYDFSVRVVDGRGAETIISRHFVVRFDNRPPVIDSVICPPGKPPKVFPWEYRIYAQDVARSPRAATPDDSLQFTYRFRTPCRTIEADPEWSEANWRIDVFVDGQSCPGDYVFRCKVRDRAWNVSEEFVCDFTIEE
jgi:hypothetical protein